MKEPFKFEFKVSNPLNTQKGGKDEISILYDEAHNLCRMAEYNSKTDQEAEQQTARIQSEFIRLGSEEGMLFCQKVKAIILEKRGDAATGETEKIQHYESAHDIINETILRAEQLNWIKPSFLKRQAVIKAKLAEALHRTGDHYNANILESDSGRIFRRILREYPDYAEAHLETANAIYLKTRWMLRKILYELHLTENLLNGPQPAKRLPDAVELQGYKQRIDEMYSTVNLLMAITK